MFFKLARVNILLEMTSKSLMQAVVKIERDDCPVTNALSGADCYVEHLALCADQHTLHSVKPLNSCDTAPTILSKSIKSRTIKNGEVWVESKSCSVCSFLSSLSFVHINGCIVNGENMMQVTLIVPSLSDLRLLKHKLADSGLEYDIEETSSFAHKGMTKRERDALEFALAKRYFDCQDRTSLTELAQSIGISPSSLSELLRRGTKKAVTYYLERKSK